MYEHIDELLAKPSSTEWEWMLYITIGLVLCAIVGEIIRKQFHWSAEVSRKIVHISVGILIFFAPLIFVSALIPLVLSIVAMIAMAFAVKTGLLVGMHGASRFSYGTVFYPFSFFILIVLFWYRHPEIVSLSMLGLAIGDAFAAIVGESLKSATTFRLTSDMKSVEGTITMFIMTMLSLIGGMYYLGLQESQPLGYLIATAAVAAIIATAWEAISSKGFDNFTVPISIAFVLFYFFAPSQMRDVSQFTTGISLSILIAVASYYLRILNLSGAIATFLLASVIYGIGGWKWTLPILTFFILSSLISRIGNKKKLQYENIFEKSSKRDWGQVLANGGVAGLIVVCQYIFQDYDFYPIYLGVVAAAMADTWGTEIGLLISGKTFSISRLKSVAPGTNGGVSLGGFASGALGALFVAGSSYPFIYSDRIFIISAFAGVIGSLVDSFIGGTIQAQYKCSVCNKITEKKLHCNLQTELFSGLKWLNNDFVNFICVVSGGAIAWILNLIL